MTIGSVLTLRERRKSGSDGHKTVFPRMTGCITTVRATRRDWWPIRVEPEPSASKSARRRSKVLDRPMAALSLRNCVAGIPCFQECRGLAATQLANHDAIGAQPQRGLCRSVIVTPSRILSPRWTWCEAVIWRRAWRVGWTFHGHIYPFAGLLEVNYCVAQYITARPLEEFFSSRCETVVKATPYNPSLDTLLSCPPCSLHFFSFPCGRAITAEPHGY